VIDLARLAGGVLYEPAGAPEPVRFAAAELATYLHRLFGRRPERRMADIPGIWLSLGTGGPAPLEPPAGYEYAVRPAGTGASFAAATPRALLAGVYALLEAGGCRWSPRAGEEHVPSSGEALARVASLFSRPAFRRRAYAADIATWHYTVPERLAARLPSDIVFVDWMAKTGATGLLFIRHAHDSQWTVAELEPELGRRGLAVERGGHAIAELLPRELFATAPEYFPIGPDGARTDLGNVCGSNPAALAVVSARAGALAAGGAIHLWGHDLWAGGWCRCPGCSRLSASEQALVVCNAVANEIPAGTEVFHLAYHDTLTPPRIIRPHPAVVAEFAPRERCYGHAIDDPACATNPTYRAALEAHLTLFDGRVDVFEYYGDAILFGGCAVPLVEVIARDLGYYARAGVRGVSCLVFGSYSLWAYGVNVEAYARGAVDPGAAASAHGTHCDRRYGTAASAMAPHLAALERIMASVVRYGDVLLPAEREPPAHAAFAAAVEPLRTLAAAMASAADAKLLKYGADVLAAIANPPAGTDELIADAIAHLRDVDPALAGTWGAHDLELTHAFFASARRGRR
jgi:hypothetical protein